MSDPEETIEKSSSAPRGPRAARRVFAWAVGIILGMPILLAVMHVFIPTIPPEQKAPSRHVGGPCIACHFVIEGAEEVEVE